ncbi:MAG: hypothetical protein LQ352_007054 [Teloschistes flavicans]|nr:MAG: hypothetical protein LQ352_007054 [Teloschistes flavicans]
MADKKDEVGGGMEDRVLDYDTTTPVLDEDSVDPVYKAKAHVLNNAIQNIGMGRYQWECDLDDTNGGMKTVPVLELETGWTSMSTSDWGKSFVYCLCWPQEMISTMTA